MRFQVVNRLFRALCWVPFLLVSFVPIPAALRYEHRVTNDPLSIHILWCDPAEASITLARAHGTVLGRETVASMAERVGAQAAINGGFFRIGGEFDGDPAGILKVGDSWFSDPGLPRGAVGWKDGGASVLLGRLDMRWRADIGGRRIKLDGINCERGAWTIIAYTSEFAGSTLAHPGGIELQVDAGGRVSGLVETGNAAIPAGGFVISFGSRVTPPDPKTFLQAVARLEHEFLPADDIPPERWEAMEYILGGTPILIRNGDTVEDYSSERVKPSFVEERHPRTAVGILPDGTWVLVVVDGRRPELSTGTSLRELAALMLSLGCRDALNLDGGGSSTFFIYGRTVNSPSDLEGDRPVSDAIVVREHRKLPDRE